MKAFQDCTCETFLLDDAEIERRHNKGWPYTRESFLYTVTGHWDALSRLGITKGVERPKGRKRVNDGSFGEREMWKIRAAKYGQWSLTLSLDKPIDAIDTLILDNQAASRPPLGDVAVIEAERREASAILEVGTEVDLWFDNEGPPRRATISRPYGPMVVRSPDAGQYVNKGDRVEYRCGYATKNDKGEEVFLPAHMVTPVGESYGHLRLVR
ncbi:hypothetical protein [Polaromonas sp.]|uniref:hypothetical protein n=1 Tax=Polaromonas sp. TaxID=1869339 RepID=UPI003264A177